MNLVLVGYRASGKTTVGQALARSLGWTFVDTDEQTRQRFGGRSIAEIWGQEGEPEFRSVECQVVAEVLEGDQNVIALGGGTVMQADARIALEAAEEAICIYLQAPAEVLNERINADTGSEAERPALTSHGGGLEEVVAMLEKRQPAYLALADHVFDTSELKIDQVDDAAAKLVVLAGLG